MIALWRLICQVRRADFREIQATPRAKDGRIDRQTSPVACYSRDMLMSR